MSKPLSLDLRTRVLAAIWRALERTQGDAKAKAIGGDRRSERMERHGDAIRSLVAETPDITLEEIRTALAARGVSASYGALWRFLRRHKITRKKRPRTRPSSIVRRREAWFEVQVDLDPERLI